MIPRPLDLNTVTQYVEAHIGSFHEKRLRTLETIRLSDVLKRKNPYLFRAKYVMTAEALVRGILDAFLQSQEETLFGDFIEGAAVHVCQQVYGGVKPSQAAMEGIDLVFQKGGKLYVVEIKSGPNWGNSSQIKRMLDNFVRAKAILAPRYPDLDIVAVNGCSYGNPPRFIQRSGAYMKVCGQDFWQFISGSETLYTEIIEPLGHQAKQRSEAFAEEYTNLVNRFTRQFLEHYCLPSGAINWTLLVEHVSKRRTGVEHPFME